MERLTRHVLPDEAGECTRGRPFACSRLSLKCHAIRSHFPLPPTQNPENTNYTMLWFERREKWLALAATRLEQEPGRSDSDVALGGASSRTKDERKGDDRRTEVERLTRHVLPDEASECIRGRPFTYFCLSLL